MQGSAFDNLRMFRKLCGDDALKNVLLVTTFWDTVSASEGVRREQELATNDEFWGRMVTKYGSKMKRWTRNADSGATMAILGSIGPDSKCALKAQIEIVEEGKQIKQTDAARATAEAVRAEVNARLRREQEEMNKRMERQRREAQRKIQRERARLRQEAEDRRRREQEARQQAEEEAYGAWMEEQRQIQAELRIEKERREQEQQRIQQEIEEESRKAEKARYYTNYRCCQYGVRRSRSCDRCGSNLHKRRDFYYRTSDSFTNDALDY